MDSRRDFEEQVSKCVLRGLQQPADWQF